VEQAEKSRKRSRAMSESPKKRAERVGRSRRGEITEMGFNAEQQNSPLRYNALELDSWESAEPKNCQSARG